MCDLDQLAREIAATSDAWIVPGVEALREGLPAIRICILRDGLAFGLTDQANIVRCDLATLSPNLRDPVTVNALLGDGEVIWLSASEGWAGYHGEAGGKGHATRTEAIARAWIAAHRSQG